MDARIIQRNSTNGLTNSISMKATSTPLSRTLSNPVEDRAHLVGRCKRSRAGHRGAQGGHGAEGALLVGGWEDGADSRAALVRHRGAIGWAQGTDGMDHAGRLIYLISDDAWNGDLWALAEQLNPYTAVQRRKYERNRARGR